MTPISLNVLVHIFERNGIYYKIFALTSYKPTIYHPECDPA